MISAEDNIDHKQVYDEITKIYDIAEGMIDSIEAEGVKNPEEQLAIAEKVVSQAGDAGDELSEVYVDYVESNFDTNSGRSKRIETAVRKVFVSISEFNDEADNIKPEEDDDQNMITIEDLQKKMKMIEILGYDLPESSIQKSLRKNALRLGMKYGGLLVLAVKRLGDHMLGIMHVFQKLMLGEVVSAIPNRHGWKLKGVIRDAQVVVPVLNRNSPSI